MKDVLSQSEIDSLIQALSAGEFDDSKVDEQDSMQVKDYDFRRPNKFSKEQMRTLRIIHENFARVLSNFLTAYLRTNIQIKLATVSQVTFEEFIFSLPIPTVMTVFTAAEKLGSAMLETNPQFVFPIIDLLFGGKGTMPTTVRELTEIELTVMRRVMVKILENLRYAWEDVYQLEPVIENIDTNPQFNQMIASTETVALMTFSTEIGDAKGLLNVCFPYMTLEPAIPNLTAQHWFSASRTGERDNRLLEKGLEPVEVELTAVLGHTEVRLEDFLQFEVGDVILLEQKISAPMNLLVEGRPMFAVQAGVYQGKKAIQLLAEKEEQPNG
ncbi:MAG: flagellar motor switch protein FliM [Firmicutes bacterium]|nr:flagellar motor switch protein FliM [Bacillota bacterium]